jgi:SAM-dependent methyltransferase
MAPTKSSTGYDEKYRSSNYFGYRVWLYRPFVNALVCKAGLRHGERLLDAGCGQGFFTQLFAERGLDAVGVDVSAAGLSSAAEMYRSSGAKFELGDVLELACRNEFDCVFTRSCSLYNSREFETKHDVTDQLLSYLRPGGILIFDYYSRLGATEQSQEWIYHSLASVQNHFSRYPGAEVYFSLRMETMLLGRLAFSRQVSGACAWLGSRLGLGGELVVFLRKAPVLAPLP